MNKIGLILLLIFTSFVPCFAEEGTISQGFGIHFGNVSGNGYSWRILSNNIGIQLVLGGYTSGNNDYYLPQNINFWDSTQTSIILKDYGKKYNFNAGLNLILPLKESEKTMFYMCGGLNWLYNDRRVYRRKYNYSGNGYTYNAVGPVERGHNIKSYVNVGLGPGMEFYLGKYVKLAAELPMTYTGKDEFIMYIPQIGLYYYFK